MNEDTAHDIGVDIDMAKNIMADKIYESDASALREQYTNALSHGCVAYHEKYGYTDDVYVDITFDHGERTVTIRDNGMGMSKDTFKNVFMYFGNSTVSKKDNNKRSGMFGLGAISFFRIASSCIVESYHRETGQHYSFMTRGKNVTEILDGNKIMMGGEHNHDKNIIGDYGTMTKIFLKENVKIKELVNMVKVVGANYPARTLLHVVNSEGEQSIETYQQEDQDEEIEFPAIKTFEDFVKLECSNPAKNGEDYRYEKVLDDEHVEIYLTEKPVSHYGEGCDAYLCRVPIKIELSKYNRYHFATYVNIKQEKYLGINDEGEDELLAIPMMNRDRVEQRADEWIDQHLIDTIIPELQTNNHFTTVQEFRDIDSTWMHTRYNMENIYDDDTKSFVQKMRRIRVRRRDLEHGLSKPRDEHDLWEITKIHSHIFYHPTCHSDSFHSVAKFLLNMGIDRKEICVIGETVKQRGKYDNGEQKVSIDSDTWANGGKEQKGMVVHDFTGLGVIDIKEFKRAHTIKAVKPSYDRPEYDSGAKVWIPTGHGYSISFTEEDLRRKDVKSENVYWAGNYIKYNEIRSTRLVYLEFPYRDTIRVTGKHSEKYGLIVAKKYPKSVPKIDELFEHVEDLIDSGEIYIWDVKSDKKIFFEEDWNLEKDGKLSWHSYKDDNGDVRDYDDIKIFDSEKSTALTSNNSALIKRGFRSTRHSKINYFDRATTTSPCHGIMFVPSKMVNAAILYFGLKHGKYLNNTKFNENELEDLKHFPKWATSDDVEWRSFYEEKRIQQLIDDRISEYQQKYPTVIKMIQWAREGSVEKFEKIKWDIEEIERTPEPDEVYDANKLVGLDEQQRKSIEEDVMDLLLKIHPSKQMMIDIIKCGVTKDDCITVNVKRDENYRRVKFCKTVDETVYGYTLFIKLSKMSESAKHYEKNYQPSIRPDHIDFDQLTIEDGKVTHVFKENINSLIGDEWYYHNGELYCKYFSHNWGHGY